MNYAGAVTGTVNSNTASLAVQIQNKLALLDENATKGLDADTLGKLKTVVGHIVECEQDYQELEEQEATPISHERSTTHPAGAIFERRRTHSVAPRLMARIPTPNFDFLDPFSVRYLNDKEIKLNQKQVVLEKKLANLKERETLQQQMYDLMQNFIANIA